MGKKAKKKRDATDSCECFAQVQEQLATINASLRTEMLITFSTGECHMSTPCIQVEKIDSKNRKPLTTLFASYCPFCGTKYFTRADLAEKKAKP